MVCLTCHKKGYRERGIVLKHVCAILEKEDKLLIKDNKNNTGLIESE